MSDDGGAAFPRQYQHMEWVDKKGHHTTYSDDGANGMSLRDYFAGQALPVVAMIISMPGARARTGEPITEAMTASQAYAIADAMIAERAK